MYFYNQNQIKVNFRNSSQYSSALEIQCNQEEKVSELIQKYRIKSGNYAQNIKFIYNAKNLNPDLTLAEAGVINGANVFVVTRCDIKGGGMAISFTDVSKNITREIQFSPDAPSYRRVSKGINIYGACVNPQCRAHNDGGVYVMIKEKKLDLIKNKDKLLCPECKVPINPESVAFYLCRYTIYGKKIEDDRIVSFRNPPGEATSKNSVSFFDQDLNGETMFSQLVFEVLKYF